MCFMRLLSWTVDSLLFYPLLPTEKVQAHIVLQKSTFLLMITWYSLCSDTNLVYCNPCRRTPLNRSWLHTICCNFSIDIVPIFEGVHTLCMLTKPCLLCVFWSFIILQTTISSEILAKSCNYEKNRIS